MAEKKQSSPLFAIIVAVLALALAAEGVMILKPKTQRPEDSKGGIRNDPITYLGRDKNAPIQIEFYAPFPLEWHQKTLKLLKEYDQKHPGRIYAKLMPMGNPEADKVMNGRGFTCAVTFINGKHEFVLPNGKDVDLQKRPNNGDGSFYNSEDVITVLDNLKVPEKK